LAKSTKREYGFEKKMKPPPAPPKRGVWNPRKQMTLCDSLFVISYSLFS
jgi:hypothetical protein